MKSKICNIFVFWGQFVILGIFVDSIHNLSNLFGWILFAICSICLDSVLCKSFFRSCFFLPVGGINMRDHVHKDELTERAKKRSF